MKMLLPFSKLSFTSEFVAAFPGDPEPKNFVRRVNKILYSEVKPTAVSNPKLVGWSDRLAKKLGIEKPTSTDLESLFILSGNALTASMRPYAARYGGHQFGNWAGQLGDGRAITLGEANTDAGRLEFQLKGAGPTPYSRRADGRAVLRSSLREFICSEAMHFLGVPTTRALSLVLTGDPVTRDMFYDGNAKDEPGAVVCRVAQSFIRFGNFEILASSGETELLKDLVDHVIREYYPGLSYEEFLHEVARNTAMLMAEWMRVGFVHGVMNTDNMSILGITIDYGPYGWLEPFEPNWTPNTTDAEHHRYAFGNQPGIGLWNIARFAEAMGYLIEDRTVLEQSLEVYRQAFSQAHMALVSAKLGFRVPKATDNALIEELFALLELMQADYTLFFRALSNFGAGKFLSAALIPTFYREGISSEELARLDRWLKNYEARILSEGRDEDERISSMRGVNPKFVFRNYLAQQAIQAAEAGDFSFMEKLLSVLERPYDEQPENEEFAKKRPEWAKQSPGSSTLSCSS